MRYELADGTTSDQYKIGDKFVVSGESTFPDGSVVSFYRDDWSEAPLFKLEDGVCEYTICDGQKGAYANWENLTPYKEVFSKKDLKAGEHVLLTKEGSYYLVLAKGLLQEFDPIAKTLSCYDVLDNYEEDLINEHDELSIEKVYKLDSELPVHYESSWTLIWEREKEVEELTLEEVCKQLGKNIKIIK